MPRKKGLRFAKTVTYTPAGLSVDIFFDPNEGALDFVAKFGGSTYRMDSVRDLETAMYKILKEGAGLEWQPVIVVTTLAPFYHHGWPFVGICLHRQHMAKVSDGSLRVVEWALWENKEDFNPLMQCVTEHWHTGWGEFTVPFVFDKSPDTDIAKKYYLPYTEELWEGLNEVVRGIERLRGKLGELLGTDEGVLKIAEVGGNLLKLLPEPQVESEEE